MLKIFCTKYDVYCFQCHSWAITGRLSVKILTSGVHSWLSSSTRSSLSMDSLELVHNVACQVTLLHMLILCKTTIPDVAYTTSMNSAKKHVTICGTCAFKPMLFQDYNSNPDFQSGYWRVEQSKEQILQIFIRFVYIYFILIIC